MGYSQVARKFGVSVHAIMMRAKRQQWVIPSKIAERVEKLQATRPRYNVGKSNREATIRQPQ